MIKSVQDFGQQKGDYRKIGGSASGAEARKRLGVKEDAA